MKSVIAIIVGLLLLGSTSFAQQSENKRKLEEAKRKAADERSRSFGARSSSRDEKGATISKNDAGKPQKKSAVNDQEKKSKDNSGIVIDLNKDQTKSKETRGVNTDPGKSNAPAVIQTTTSESGSPAILSGDDGNERDGTNNVQRGTLKMAGAEMKGNMGLYKKDASEKNTNTTKRVQKQEEQPPHITDRPAAQSNDATVQETTPKQDESTVTKNPEKKSKAKSKKSRKGRSRDSGK